MSTTRWVGLAMAGWAVLALSVGPVAAGPNAGAGISIDFNTATVGDQKQTTRAGASVVRAHIYGHNVSNLLVADFTINLPAGVTALDPELRVVDPNTDLTSEENLLEKNGATGVLITKTNVTGGVRIAVALPSTTGADLAPEGSGLLAVVRLSLSTTTAPDLKLSFGAGSFLSDVTQAKDFVTTTNTNNVGATVNPTDAAPPAAITALTQTNLGTATGTANISWQNPAAEAGGKYIFKYAATEIITEAAWDAAAVVTNANFGGTAPAPSAAGTQTAQISGIAAGVLHGRIVDAGNNLGPISASAAINVPVELSSFVGFWTGESVVLRWETVTESGTFGWNVWRSTARDGEYARVNAQPIPAAGTTVEPQHYVYQDGSVSVPGVYWYQLELVDLDGSRRAFEPVSISTEAPVSVESSTLGEVKRLLR